MTYHNHSQFELFPGSVREPGKNTPPQFFLRNLNLSLENLVVLSIVMMIGLILCYSLGVEKGKHQMRSEMAAADQKMAQKLQNFDVPEGTAAVTPNDVASLDKPVVTRGRKSSAADVAALTSKLSQDEEIIPDLKKSAVSTLPSAEETPAEKIVDKEQNKGYTIQVASYKKDEFAQKEATVLKKKDYDAMVVSKGNYVIVCVGKFDKKEEAKVFSKKLKGQYKDLVIRSL